MIPDEAVEAAADVIKRFEGVRDVYFAAAILDASAPMLMAQAWDEAIEAAKVRQCAVEYAIYTGQTIPDEPLSNPYRTAK